MKFSRRLDDYVDTHTRFRVLLTYIRIAVMGLPLRGVEYLLATIGAATGFWIGWPWMNIYHSETGFYKIMVDYMPAWVWTTIFLVFAMPSAFLTSPVLWQLRARLIGNACLFTTWMLASLLFIVDNAPFLATAWTPIFCFYQGWTLLALWLRIDEKHGRN